MQPLIDPIDVRQQPEIAARFNVMTIPMTILIGSDSQVQQINYGVTHTQKLTQQLQLLA